MEIFNSNSNSIITGSSYSDSIINNGNRVTIYGNGENDTIRNESTTSGNNVKMILGSGNDTINNLGHHVTINGDAGNDSVWNYAYGDVNSLSASASYSVIDLGDGNDYINNSGGTNVTLIGGNGNDFIYTSGNNSKLYGGTGNDTIINGYSYISGSTVTSGDNSTLDGSTGNDIISLASGIKNNLITYKNGDDNDTIYNYSSNNTIKISDGYYSTQVSGSDTIIKIESGSMTLKNYIGIVNIDGTLGGGGKNISNSTSNTVINGTDYADTISNSAGQVKIYAGAGTDSIYNTGEYITISGGNGKDTINNGYSQYISIDGGNDDDSIYGNNNYGTITGGAGNDTIIGNHWRSNLNGGIGNDFINITDYWCNTIDGGDGDDKIIAGGGEHSVNGGAGADYISLKGGSSLTVKGGTGNDTIYGDSSSSHLYQYSKGDGSDIIFGANENDTITIIGAGYSTVSSGNDILVNVSNSGTITLSGAKGKSIKINSTDPNPEPNPSSSVTPQQVIKKFMSSLDTTTYSGIAALSQAVNFATNGYFRDINSAISQIVADCRNTGNATKFLKDYCDIDLSNPKTADTGAITGSDAGGSRVLTPEGVVPETGSLDTSFNSTSFKTNYGATFYLSKTPLSSDELYIWRALYTWWANESFKLIKDSYNYSFTDSDASVKNITVIFEEIYNGDYLAYMGSPRIINGIQTRVLAINKAYYYNFNNTDVNGKSPKGEGYLDRVVAHELTHAIMASKIDTFYDLPQFITEGTAELVHGIDDERGNIIEYLAGNASMLQNSLSLEPGTGGNYEYASGFIFLRYLAKQGSEHYSNSSDFSGSRAIAGSDNDITIKGSVLTLGKDFANKTIDLTSYSSVTKVDATKTSNGIMIVGNQKANSISAGSGNDTISGNTGNDTILGGNGNDAISGDSGDDVLNGGVGNDTITGGGNDVFVYSNGDGNDIITDYTTSDKIKILTGSITNTSVNDSDAVFKIGSVLHLTLRRVQIILNAGLLIMQNVECRMMN
ncbi:MAG: hypothetical protein IJ728_10970 [Selenomonadaceae bacterium]|nr:hypothetical protein [Selenomonadaceae bacterium]